MTDPQDIRSEEALLGALLVAPESVKQQRVEADEFYLPRYGLIWDAAMKCAKNGGSDPVTVAAELERRGQLEEIGGRDRLFALAASVPTPGNAGAYAKRVKETAELRRLRRSAQAILEAVENEDEPSIAIALDTLGSPIRYVDVASGELVETCPTCTDKDGIITKLEHLQRRQLGRISQLEGKAEKVAREHKLWPEVSACFDIYKVATGHFRLDFTVEQFNQALPRWKQEGRGRRNPCKGALKAICGIAYDPTTTKGRNQKQRRYDSWELLTRSQEKWLDFQSRVPGSDDTAWWRVLMDLIDGNLKQ